MQNNNSPRIDERGGPILEEQPNPSRQPFSEHCTPSNIDNALPEEATCGGFPYEWLPTINHEQWFQAVKNLPFPRRELSAWEEFRKRARLAASKHLTPEILYVLHEFARPDGPDAFVLDHLPIDIDMGPTPIDGQRHSDKSAVSETVITGIIEEMGYQILSYIQEKNGDPFHQLVPILGHEAKQSNTGRAKFGFHTDNANIIFRFKQECLGLFGLRNERNTPTLIMTLDDIKKVVPQDLLRKLRYPIYHHPAPLSFDLAGWSVLTEPRPIIWTDDMGIDRIALPRSEFEQVDAEANATIKRFRDFLNNVEPRRVVVQPGRFLAFRDSRVLHGRDTVVGDRWLQRVYFSRTLAPQRMATNSDPREFAFDVRLLMMV